MSTCSNAIETVNKRSGEAHQTCEVSAPRRLWQDSGCLGLKESCALVYTLPSNLISYPTPPPTFFNLKSLSKSDFFAGSEASTEAGGGGGTRF